MLPQNGRSFGVTFSLSLLLLVSTLVLPATLASSHPALSNKRLVHVRRQPVAGGEGVFGEGGVRKRSQVTVPIVVIDGTSVRVTQTTPLFGMGESTSTEAYTSTSTQAATKAATSAAAVTTTTSTLALATTTPAAAALATAAAVTTTSAAVVAPLAAVSTTSVAPVVAPSSTSDVAPTTTTDASSSADPSSTTTSDSPSTTSSKAAKGAQSSASTTLPGIVVQTAVGQSVQLSGSSTSTSVSFYVTLFLMGCSAYAAS